MTQLLQLVFTGLAIGSVIALAAVGVSLVYGGLKIINFAQGDYMTLGAYLALGASSGWHLPVWLAVVIGTLGVAAFAIVIELIIWRPLRARHASLLAVFVTAIGLALVLRQAILFVAGGAFQQFAVDAYGVYHVRSLRLPEDQVIALAVALPVIVALALMLARTPLGKAIRGLADNPELTAISGIDPGKLAIVIWALAGGMAGLAGVLLGLVQTSFDTNLGWTQLLTVFCAVVLGGIGSAYGALAGGLVIGLVMSVSLWSGFAGGVPGSYQLVVPFVALVAILLVRPSGLLGRSRVL
jgi:branched-subunit amino acid ABC-type transport system permease component